MLIQSTPESITLLPALPDNWSTGSFNGLRARGAYTIDAEWKDKKVNKVTISSDKGGVTTLKVNGKNQKITLNPGEIKTLRF